MEKLKANHGMFVFNVLLWFGMTCLCDFMRGYRSSLKRCQILENGTMATAATGSRETGRRALELWRRRFGGVTWKAYKEVG